MRGRTRQTTLRWIKLGCGGCAGLVALLVLLGATVVWQAYRGYGQGLEIREEVDRRYGASDSFRMRADGTVAADRMERFLAIRRSLLPRCPEVTEIVTPFQSVETLAQEESPDVIALFRQAARAVRRVPSVGKVFGDYVTARNQALLDQGVGLGEYSWVYTVSYFGLLGQPPVRVLAEGDRPRIIEDRLFPEIAAVIERHVAERGLESGPWVSELERLAADPERVPFEGGLPAELEASLAPHREALSRLACPAAAELDVSVTVRRSRFGYDHR